MGQEATHENHPNGDQMYVLSTKRMAYPKFTNQDRVQGFGASTIAPIDPPIARPGNRCSEGGKGSRPMGNTARCGERLGGRDRVGGLASIIRPDSDAALSAFRCSAPRRRAAHRT
ncbi:hypothetical protein Trydic_g5009 [Trypoxylus dichotomus]